jgi:glycosyltransferase involved in cell wall biosynthesis
MSVPRSPEAPTEILFVEPHSGGRISGGYLYNQRIAAAAPEVRRCPVAIDTLQRDLARLDTRDAELVLLDSLFLTPELASPFTRLERRGKFALGVLLHAFPSFIARAGDREQLASALPLRPTRQELTLLKALDVLVAPGPHVPRLLAECGAGTPCVVCPPGVDHPPPRAPRAESAVVRFLSLGAVTRLKGFRDALLALSTVRSRAWRWTIAGSLEVEPEFVAELQSLCAALQLDSNVCLAGQLDHAAALAILHDSDALLISSFTENHPLVALEALAAGVPVAGYAVGGLPDIIRHAHTGLLAPHLDVAGLAALLERLVLEPVERQRLAQNAAQAGAALPSWQDAGRQFVSNVRAGRAPGEQA